MARPYKMGLIPPPRTLNGAKRMLVLAQHLDPLGPPPAESFPWWEAVEKQMGGPDQWQLFLNDQYGDCVIADDLHLIMINTANGKGPFKVPTDSDALRLYEQIAGFNPNDPNTDNGTDPRTNYKYFHRTGFDGEKYQAAGNIDPCDMPHMEWGLHIFSGLRLCINCPDIAFDQFPSGIWDYKPGTPYTIEGGHDIRGVGYTTVNAEPLIEVITWGQRISMTWAFWQKFAMIAEADLCPDVIQATGVAPTGLGLQQMVADLKHLA